MTTSHRISKRLIIACDGTWQDGIVMQQRWQYTNVLRLSRCVYNEDKTTTPHTPQVVFYQSGIGSDPDIYSYLQGATGASLAEKVQEAYAFIATNYCPGDEIFLFGFSRGAYTARMVAMFIGAIGILNRKDMDHFAAIFVAFQKRGKTDNQKELADLDRQLEPWMRDDAYGKVRATSNARGFSVKCVGVFDTVGSIGLPEELTLRHKGLKTIFGFPDKLLGEHVENAFQALAINETRADFLESKFEQSEAGRKKGQVLKQVWFAGSHSDIGGGWQDSDLAEITLAWMISNIGSMLSLDTNYLHSLPKPSAPYGQMQPHDPQTGIFSHAATVTRKLPTSTNDITYETIHSSVLKQKTMTPVLQKSLEANPQLVHPLLDLEEAFAKVWPFNPSSPEVAAYEKRITADNSTPSLVAKIEHVGARLGHDLLSHITRTETMHTQAGVPVYGPSLVAKLAHETPLGVYVTALNHEADRQPSV